MNATKWVRIYAVAAAAAGLSGTVMATDAGLTPQHDQSSTDLNSAAQLGPGRSAAPQRKGDSSVQHGTDNAAAQLGSSLNANPGAQLNNDTQGTSTPPADSDDNTAGQPVKSHPDAASESHK